MSKEFFAIDLGNKQTKLASDKGTYRLPSYYALKREDALSNFSMNFDSDLDIHTFETVDGKRYLWGNDIDKIVSDNDIKDTIMVDEGRYNDADFINVSQFAIALLGKDYTEEEGESVHANVITGLPTFDYESDQTVKMIKSTMKQHVMMKVDGTSVDVTIDKVIVIPQPVGTVFDVIVSENKKELQEENVIVADLGGGTLLIDTLNNLTYNSEATVQKKQGAYQLYDKIFHALKISGRPNIHTIEKIVREGSEKGKYVYHVRKNKDIDITDVVKTEIDAYTESVISSIKHSGTSENEIDEVIFTGGGSNIVNKDMIKDAFDNVAFTTHNEMSNVLGFLIAGKSKKF